MAEPAAAMTEQTPRQRPGPKPGVVVGIGDLKRTAKSLTEVAVTADDPRDRIDAAALLLEMSTKLGRPAWLPPAPLPVEASPSEEVD